MHWAKCFIPFWNHADVSNTMWLVNTPCKHETLTQCWSNAGLLSATLAQHQTSTGSTPRVCWELRSIARWSASAYSCGEYKPTPTQCLLNVGPASPVLASIHLALVSASWWRLRHDALNQSWVNVGPNSAMLAHIQRGAKYDTVTQYWANVGLPS